MSSMKITTIFGRSTAEAVVDEVMAPTASKMAPSACHARAQPVAFTLTNAMILLREADGLSGAEVAQMRQL
jgi:hypothetical protein